MAQRIVDICTRGFVVLLMLSVVGCHASAPMQSNHDRQSVDHPDKANESPTVDPAPSPAETPVIEDMTGRWVYPLLYKKGSTGGWVHGSFDQKRNKITIDTRDVGRFRVDLTKLTVNWDRLVILRLNGKSSELRRRDSDVIDFEIDDHGNWVVDEP